MIPESSTDPPPPDHGSAGNAGPWRALPVQARTMFALSGLLAALPPAVLVHLLIRIFDLPLGATTAVVVVTAAAAFGAGIGAWFGVRRYRHTHWRVDRDGFSLRKGRLWRSDLRVPRNRVQHLDLRRGPLERRYGLATLVIHTAGTRDSAVNVGGLAQADAEVLRDLLARQTDHDHADDDIGRNPGAPPSAAISP